MVQNRESDFPKSYERGEEYEGKFYKWYKTKYPHKNITWLKKEFEADFLINNCKLELKSDFTQHTNFFIEYFSNMETERMGGPYQAKNSYNAKYYSYWFVDETNPNQWKFYNFKLTELLEWLSIHKNCYPTRRKENKGYQTLGHIIPVDILSKQSFCKVKTVEIQND